MLQVGKVSNRERSKVGSFYSEVGYFAELGESDTIVVAQENLEIIGSVRLCHEAGFLVLRGMYVSERKLGTGVGAALLLNASKEIGLRECWCIPYDYLSSFYGQAGFKEYQSNATPPFLAARAASYLDQGKPVVIMKRLGHWSVFA